MARNWKWIAITAVLGAVLAIGIVTIKPSLGGGEALAGDGGSSNSTTSAAQASDITTNTVNHINVIGQASIKVAPDTVMVNVGVQTVAKTAQEAQTNNNKQMDAVIAALKAMGITDSQMATTGISLFPESDPNINPDDPIAIVRYRASNQITVTSKDLTQAAPILDTAIGAGANSNGSVSFTVEDDSSFRTQAIEQAVKNSRPKAEAAARGLGVTIKDAIIVDETTTAGTFVVDTAQGLGGGGATPIIPGQITVTEIVKVVYTY